MNSTRKRIEANVRRFVLDENLVAPRDVVLAGVSGGPDSLAMLLILQRLSKNRRFRLNVAHFDHGLRGEAVSDAEAGFVGELADSLGLAFFTASSDVRALAKSQHRSLEDAARRARYDFLATTAQAAGCNVVSVGHTASDQAETVLLRIIRGTGLAGLIGMTPRSDWPFRHGRGVKLVRPLLRVTHDETQAYCRAAGVEPIADETNFSPEFQRNRVRLELLPLLRQLNPRIEDSLVRLADAAAQDISFIESEVASLLDEPGPAPQTQSDGSGTGIRPPSASADRPEASSLQATPASQTKHDQAGTAGSPRSAGGKGARRRSRLPRRDFRSWPVSIRRHAVRLALTDTAGDPEGFSEPHLRDVERLLLEGKTGDRIDLPHSITAVLQRQHLELRSGGGAKPLPPDAVDLPVPGRLRFDRLEIEAALQHPGEGVFVELDAGAAGHSVCIRRRRPGDRFQPLGMEVSKKLQDFFVDSHIPREERDSIPLFVSDRGILWAGGLRIAEWAKPRTGRPTLFLSFTRISDEEE
jgi:tRNA(Ile)-lysidine synthase